MAAAGIRELLSLRFDEALTAMSAEDFVRRVIVGRLAAREVWVGEDFRFGHRRGGDFALYLGEDVSIGYLSHDDKKVRLYLQESMTFRLLTTEASVALTDKAKAKS